MDKRKAEKGIDKYGGQSTKKKVLQGPDIPSSNLAAPKEKKAFKNSVITSSMISSVPNLPTKVQTVSKVLHNLQLPEKLKEVIGPDVEKLLRYKKEKEKREALEAERRRRFEKMHPNVKQEKPPEEEQVEEIKPKEIYQDESGRIRDEKGNVINLKPSNTASLKINLNKAKEERVKELLKFQRASAITANRFSKIFDPELVTRSKSLREKKKNNAFQFIEKGSIIQKAEALRGNIVDSEQKDQNAMSIEKPEDGATLQQIPAGINRVAVRVKRHDPVPDVEWWDLPLIPQGRNSYLPFEEPQEKPKDEEKKEGDQMKDEEQDRVKQQALVEKYKRNLETLEQMDPQDFEYRREKITHMIEHPAAFRTPGSNQPVTIPVFLTKEERKKLRRRKRLERERVYNEKQEKIKLGLMDPPPPKVKLSNFMNVLKDRAVADPTQVEMEVRKAMADRLQAHLERNAKRKLTKEQRAEKFMRKLRRDSALECRVAIFRVEDLSNGAHRFKVNMNAQQLALNGVCIIPDKKAGLNLPAVVVVEGGPRAIKFYKKLMLRRIKWNTNPKKPDEKEGEGEEAAEAPATINNSCKLVWEGVVKDHNFNRWKVIDIKNEIEGRRMLADRGVEHYWDNALKFNSQNLDED